MFPLFPRHNRMNDCPPFLAVAPIIAIIILTTHVTPAYGHVESSMPDAMAEMEYIILLDLTPDDIATRNKLALVLFRRNKIVEAEKQLHLVLQKSPDNADALDTLGLIRHAQKEYSRAVAYYKKAIAADPADGLIYYHLGNTYEITGKRGEAEDNYRAALELLKKQNSSVKDMQPVRDALKRVRPRI